MEEGILLQGHTCTLSNAVVTRTFALMVEWSVMVAIMVEKTSVIRARRVGENAIGPLKFQGLRCAIRLLHRRHHILLPTLL